MKKLITAILRSERGATAIEYGLMTALIAVAIIISFENLGGASRDMWNTVTNKTVENIDN